MGILAIAIRNFLRQRRRFFFLGFSIAAAFVVACTLQSLVSGINDQLGIRGARFYGGHVMIFGFQNTPEDIERVDDPKTVELAIKNSGVSYDLLTYRSFMYGTGTIFGNGNSVDLRRVVGLDWKVEASVIGRMEFVAGTPANFDPATGILISDVVAKRLQVSLGDSIVLQAKENNGHSDTISLTVDGIFREVSIFGYFTAYMDRHVMNHLTGRPPESANMIGLYLSDERQAPSVANKVHNALQSLLPVMLSLKDKDAYSREAHKKYQGFKYGVLPIMGFLYEIRFILQAVSILSYAVLAMIFLVIAVGIANTYRVLLYERTREIGTMRALGMQASQVQMMILFEAAYLSLASIAAGLLLTIVVLQIAGMLSFPVVPGFDIFLDRGHPAWDIQLDTVLIDAIIITVVTVGGAWGAGRAASRIRPAEALRDE